MASSLSWIPSAEKRLQRDAGIIIETATNDTRAENHVLSRMDLWGKKEEKKNGEPEEKVTEPIVRGRKLSRGCFEEKNIVRWKLA